VGVYSVEKTLLILPPSPLNVGIKVVFDETKLLSELLLPLFPELPPFEPVLEEPVALNPSVLGMARKSPVKLTSTSAGKLLPGTLTVKSEAGIVVPRTV
jgi:hypothetical protein